MSVRDLQELLHNPAALEEVCSCCHDIVTCKTLCLGSDIKAPCLCPILLFVYNGVWYAATANFVHQGSN